MNIVLAISIGAIVVMGAATFLHLKKKGKVAYKEEAIPPCSITSAYVGDEEE